MNPLAVSYPQAAELLGKSVRTIRGLIRDGRLAVVRLPYTRPIVRLAEIERYLGIEDFDFWRPPPVQPWEHDRERVRAAHRARVDAWLAKWNAARGASAVPAIRKTD